MTSQPTTTQRSLFDHPLDLTDARIAELRSSAASARAQVDPVPGPTSGRGPLRRFRDGLGVRLIHLGAALVTDETIRRRVVRP